MEDFLGFIGAFALLALVLTALTLGIIFAVPAAIAFAILYGVYQHHHGPQAIAKRAEQETQALYQQALAVAPYTLERLEEELDEKIVDPALRELGVQLFIDEDLLPPRKPPPNPASIEGARYRDELNAYIAASHDQKQSAAFVDRLLRILTRFDRPEQRGLFEASRARTPAEIEELILAFFSEQEDFRKLRAQLNKNFNEQGAKYPTEYRGDNCAWDYLKDTPLLELEWLKTSANWKNPENHSLVLAGSGAGKTTLFKHLIAHLLKDDVCVIVMDSQSQVIEELASIDLPDGDVAWITPENPLALNPFAATKADLGDEAFVNNVAGQLTFVIDKLIDAPMTPRQRTLFFHCTNLVLNLRDGTIDTFFAALDNPLAFSDQIEKMDEASRRFFFEELKGEGRKLSPYESTKTELRYRLDALLRNPTLRRVFNTSGNTFDFAHEMNERRLVLIDTSIALLADQSATFGRFMIAQALRACYARVKGKDTARRVVLFVDEAHEYFDEKLETMLLQARKANVGLVIATQDLARASRADIADTLVGSTTTKIVSRVVAGDARRLASAMKTEPANLLQLPDHTFAFSSGGETAVSIRADVHALDQWPARFDLAELKQNMAKRYGPKPESEGPEGDDPDEADSGETVASDNREAENGEAKGNDRDPIPDGDKSTGEDQSASPSPSQSTMSENENQDIEPSPKL